MRSASGYGTRERAIDGQRLLPNVAAREFHVVPVSDTQNNAAEGSMPPFSSLISRVTRSAMTTASDSVVLSAFRRTRAPMLRASTVRAARPALLRASLAPRTRSLASVIVAGDDSVFATATVSTPSNNKMRRVLKRTAVFARF